MTIQLQFPLDLVFYITKYINRQIFTWPYQNYRMYPNMHFFKPLKEIQYVADLQHMISTFEVSTKVEYIPKKKNEQELQKEYYPPSLMRRHYIMIIQNPSCTQLSIQLRNYLKKSDHIMIIEQTKTQNNQTANNSQEGMNRVDVIKVKQYGMIIFDV